MKRNILLLHNLGSASVIGKCYFFCAELKWSQSPLSSYSRQLVEIEILTKLLNALAPPTYLRPQPPPLVYSVLWNTQTVLTYRSYEQNAVHWEKNQMVDHWKMIRFQLYDFYILLHRKYTLKHIFSNLQYLADPLRLSGCE